MRNVLRPAALSDIYPKGLRSASEPFYNIVAYNRLQELFEAEWRKRGYLRSP